MARLWQQIRKGEKGQALPIVLVMLVIGGLLIAPSLSYASTSLKAGQVVKENVRGIYAADAGVEDALWKLKKGLPISELYYLPEPVVNQMQQVEIVTENLEEYTLYFGELIEVTEQHYDWLAVDKAVWNEGGGTYKYIITVTWQPYPGKPNINLEEVGVRLPVGYEYKPDSAASFLGDELFSTDDPYDIRQDGADAYMYKWEFDTTVSQDDPIATQTFYVTGEEGGLDGDYTWVVGAHGQSIGEVGEVIGTLYRITATATSDSGSSTTIEAYVLVSSGDYTTTEGNFILEAGQVYSNNVDAGRSIHLYQDAILNGNAIAEENVHLYQGAIINGNVCAEGNVHLYQDAIINGNVYAGGNVQLGQDATIIGNVYAEHVTYENREDITGEIYPYEGCGLSLTGNRLEILNWEVN